MDCIFAFSFFIHPTNIYNYQFTSQNEHARETKQYHIEEKEKPLLQFNSKFCSILRNDAYCNTI